MPPVIIKWRHLTATITRREVTGRWKSKFVWRVAAMGVTRDFGRYVDAERYARRMVRQICFTR